MIIKEWFVRSVARSLYISHIIPLLYIHHPRNHRTTYRAFIFCELRITLRATNCVFARREPRIDAIPNTHDTLVLAVVVVGFFGCGEMRGRKHRRLRLRRWRRHNEHPRIHCNPCIKPEISRASVFIITDTCARPRGIISLDIHTPIVISGDIEYNMRVKI